MKTTNNYNTSILGLLGVLFVGLKLTGVINWSWWYVTMPFWGGLVFVIVVILSVLITSLILKRD